MTRDLEAQSKRRRSLLFLLLVGLTLGLAACGQSTPKQNAKKTPAVELITLPDSEEANGETDSNTPNSIEIRKTTPAVRRELRKPTVKETTVARRFRSQSVNHADRTDDRTTIDRTSIAESWHVENLTAIREIFYSEINQSRLAASLETLERDLELEDQASVLLNEDLCYRDSAELAAYPDRDTYLLYFTSEVQLSEPEVVEAFANELQKDSSLRASLFDMRLTRFGVASCLSIRPNEDNPYVYLCLIVPASEPIETIVPPTTETTPEPTTEPTSEPTTTPEPTTTETETTETTSEEPSAEDEDTSTTETTKVEDTTTSSSEPREPKPVDVEIPVDNED